MSSVIVHGQQQADVVLPVVKNPRFEKGKGFNVFIDQSNYNFHTKSGRFKPFSDLLESDGYVVDSIIDYKKLEKNSVLVISNPINERNTRSWQRPIHSAFSPKEVSFLKDWVHKGGRLLLIADHMPFAGATNELANAFGFSFCDGFAQIQKDDRSSPDVFSIENKKLLDSEVTNGSIGIKINSVTTFTGSSFTKPEKAIGILKFTKGDICRSPEVAWRFTDTTPEKDLEYSYQGAIMSFGKGKIAVFGEAAMFTAQTITNNNGTFKFGFHSESAPNNINFIRNLLFWLGKN